MTFQLVLTEASAENHKDIGENVFFDNLDTDYKVYLFYYPGTMADRALESRLRELGDITGKNLFVNIGRLNDKRHDQIVQRFDVKKYPVIIVAAEATLASSTDEYVSAFVRLDSEHLLASPERAVDLVQKIFTLFVQGKVSEGVRHAKWSQRRDAVGSLMHIFTDALKSVMGFVADRDISVSIFEGKFELKKSEG